MRTFWTGGLTEPPEKSEIEEFKAEILDYLSKKTTEGEAFPQHDDECEAWRSATLATLEEVSKWVENA